MIVVDRVGEVLIDLGLIVMFEAVAVLSVIVALCV